MFHPIPRSSVNRFQKTTAKAQCLIVGHLRIFLLLDLAGLDVPQANGFALLRGDGICRPAVFVLLAKKPCLMDGVLEVLTAVIWSS